MNRLHAQWQRLFLAPGLQPEDGQTPPLTDAQGRTRALLLELARPADWRALAGVWQAVQQELGLPAPAIAVSGSEGFQLWFALAEPVAPADGLAFLQALSQRYLPDVAPQRLRLQAGVLSDSPVAALPPQLQAQAGQWSAFVSPDLAPVFADTPWLDVAPGADGQADLLAGLHCLSTEDLRVAAARLAPLHLDSESTEPRAAAPADPGAAARQTPQAFLSEVMNDASVPLALRIEAAKALLAHSR
ncbi:hypothetical protein [Pelomonas sp. BJYL3]|uniref:hypothetical protein n=1 Tax=Pelomonas sp. BJYL3 TaxID=2976697 RepID=UPI0022B2D708|nr:hypothetical protein [Pelomonas sp. BJYL3]